MPGLLAGSAWGAIAACLAAMQRQSGLAADFAIVAVDEPRDRTAEAVACTVARDPRIRLIRGQRVQSARDRAPRRSARCAAGIRYGWRSLPRW